MRRLLSLVSEVMHIFQPIAKAHEKALSRMYYYCCIVVEQLKYRISTQL
jgi:hypothetical protein